LTPNINLVGRNKALLARASKAFPAVTAIELLKQPNCFGNDRPPFQLWSYLPNYAYYYDMHGEKPR